MLLRLLSLGEATSSALFDVGGVGLLKREKQRERESALEPSSF